MKDHRSLLLERGIFLSWEEEFTWPSIKNPYVSDEGICQGARGMLGILARRHRGPLLPGCQRRSPLGNIFREPLAGPSWKAITSPASPGTSTSATSPSPSAATAPTAAALTS